MTTRAKLALIDGHSLAYRMYFALERTQMKSSKSIPTWGTYGFFKALFDFIKSSNSSGEKIEGLIVAFDRGRQTFRTEIYPQYKAHREEMPESLRQQLKDIRLGLETLELPIYELDNYEADDIIGTLAHKALDHNLDVTILTGDQDAYQVIDADNRIQLMMPSFSGGLNTVNRAKVIEKWGIEPEQVVDFKALKGDTSDNIPGVPGIGDKTAAKLIQDYKTLESIYENLDNISGKKLQENLRTYKEQAFLSRQLAQINFETPVQLSAQAIKYQIKSLTPFLEFLQNLEFRSLIQTCPSILGQFAIEQTIVAEQKKQSTNQPTTNGQISLLSLEVDNTHNNLKAEQNTSSEIQTTVFTLADEVPDIPYRIIETIPELDQFLATCKTNQLLCVDIETTGLNALEDKIVGIALSTGKLLKPIQYPASNPLKLQAENNKHYTKLIINEGNNNDVDSVYVPVAHHNALNIPAQDVYNLLSRVFSDASVVKIAHNAKFESNFFAEVDLHFKGLLFDTMLASYVSNPEEPHGLKQLGFDKLGIRMQEIKTLIGSGKNQKTFDTVPLQEGAAYACQDTYTTLLLAHHYVQLLSKRPSLETLLYEMELPLMQVLAQMEKMGVALDILYLGQLSQQLGHDLSSIEADIYDLADLTFNINSPKQVAEVLFEKLKIPTKEKNASKSGFSTNAKILEDLAEEHPNFPILQRILDYRQLFKLKSTYVDALPLLISRKDNRIHTSFNQTIAATGRLSSSNPNLQNIPIRSEIGRKIRGAFVPENRQDYVMVSADYSQIELRLLAHFSEDKNLIHAFQSAEDIHKATASLVFNVPLKDVTKEMRYKAKAVNFGVIYGQTAFGLSKALNIFPGEAAEFINRYFEQYPSVTTFIEETKAKAYETGEATTLFGRIRNVKEGLESKQKYVREFTERAAFNTPLQGSASDLIKLAMIRLQDKLIEHQAKSKLILQVHDEVVLEAHQDELEWLKETLRWAMELEQPLKVPLVIDIEVGASWLEGD